MNNWHNEFMAEYQRRHILQEVNQLQLEKIALRSRVYRSGWFERTMFSFANWMIATGNQLRKRYEIPVAHCNPPHTGSLAG